MKTFSPDEIRRVRAAAQEISELRAAVPATEHPLEKEQQIDLVKEFIRPGPGHSLTNLAHEIVDDKIASTVEEFLAATRPFYSSSDVAQRAAESSERVAALHHLRQELMSSPSIEQAERLLGVFTEFLASPAALAVGAEPEESETDLTGETSPVEGADAEQIVEDTSQKP